PSSFVERSTGRTALTCGRGYPASSSASACGPNRTRPSSGAVARENVSREPAEGLCRLFRELFRLVGGGPGAAGHERRLELSGDRLLRDRTLDDVVPRRQREHHVEQR